MLQTEWDKYCDFEDYDIDELHLMEYETDLRKRYEEYQSMIEEYSDGDDF